MRSSIHRIEISSNHETELINITPNVLGIVQRSGVKDGVVYVNSLHTTTGVTVNEGLADLEADIANLVQRLVPDKDLYRHGASCLLMDRWRLTHRHIYEAPCLAFKCFFQLNKVKL